MQANNTTESYSYDPVGNRTASLGVSSYTTNASNEMTANSNASYTYDSNGNTLTKTVGSNTTSYTWDFENRLTSVTLPGSGGTVTFSYDPFGRRIEKSSSATTSIFAYDGDNLIEEANSSGAVVSRYTQTQNIDEPLAMLRSSATSYYNADGLGSVTSLTNSSGAAAQTYTYDSFGNVTASSGSLTNPFQYTGREMDPGLYYYRARYYDATLGRFTGEDPLRFGSGDSNFYNYVGQDPTNYMDATGRIPTRLPGTNWCGPDWTGGLNEEFNPEHFRLGLYKKPSSSLDEACMHHDICYFNCRATKPCDNSGRQDCMRQCDILLNAEVPVTGWHSATVWWLIKLHISLDAGPNKNNCPSCKRSNTSSREDELQKAVGISLPAVP